MSFSPPYPACMLWWLFSGHLKMTSASPYLAKSRSASPGVIPWLLQGTSAGRKAEIRP